MKFVQLCFFISFLASAAAIFNNQYSRKNTYIVHLDPSHSHEAFERHLQTFTLSSKTSHQIFHHYHHVLHGLSIETNLPLSQLKSLPGVLNVVPNGRKHIVTSTESWGLDRIDQSNRSIALDGNYQSSYDGLGVDVYVVDTGLDTRHYEFTNRASRTISNIYSAFSKSKYSPGPNTDDNGHGTHCAGTIGGRMIGVSPNVNIYGLKILNGDGSGSDSDILEALDYVVTKAKSRPNNRAIVSMSLGGPCTNPDDCSSDSLVIASENLVLNHNILVVVAAGNEGCNACFGSPNAAPHAINVGAMDQRDAVTYFSNFGQCIDVFAPGMDILSACSAQICGDETTYLEMSGTSMACPHVAGTLAQYLQQNKSLTRHDLLTRLSCESGKEYLRMDPIDSISKNLLLHTPRSTVSNHLGFNADPVSLIPQSSLDHCDLGAGCPLGCSGRGLCLPAHSKSSQYSSSHRHSYLNLSTQLVCHCFKGYSGSACELTTTQSSSSSSTSITSSTCSPVTVNLYDSYGDGWTFTHYSILSQPSGLIVNNAYDSLCYGDSGTKSHCLERSQCYRFQVNYGYFPGEVSWSICGVDGGAPSSLDFCMSSSGSCQPICNFYQTPAQDLSSILSHGGGGPSSSSSSTSSNSLLNSFVQLNLYDGYGDGWQGGYYALYAESGEQKYGGTLTDGYELSEQLCLTPGKYFLLFLSRGGNPEELSLSICGVIGTSEDILEITISSSLDINGNVQCQVMRGLPTDSYCNSSSPSLTVSSSLPIDSIESHDITRGGWTQLPIYLFDLSGNGWHGSQFSISTLSTPSSSSTVLYNGTLLSGFESKESLCLPDGCYEFSAYPSPSLSLNDAKIITSSSFYSLCGTLLTIPHSTSTFCLESSYQLCYGIKGCPFIKSHARESDNHYYFITHYEIDYSIDVIVEFGNIHGVHDLCEMSDGCYDLWMGGGRDYLSHPILDATRFDSEICGLKLTSSSFPRHVRVCFSSNGTQCEATLLTPEEDPATNQIQICSSPSLSPSPVSSSPSSESDTFPALFMKLDAYGDGWGSDATYQITESLSNLIIAQGGLDGQIESDIICLKKQTCYSLSVLGGGRYAGEIFWMFCGLIGGTDFYNQQFCTTNQGCEFVNLPNEYSIPMDYYQLEKSLDDDFPSDPNHLYSDDIVNNPSRIPHSSPTLSPTLFLSPPTFMPSISLSPNFIPPTPASDGGDGGGSESYYYYYSYYDVAPPTHKPTSKPTNKPSVLPSVQPSFPSSSFPSSFSSPVLSPPININSMSPTPSPTPSHTPSPTSRPSFSPSLSPPSHSPSSSSPILPETTTPPTLIPSPLPSLNPTSTSPPSSSPSSSSSLSHSPSSSSSLSHSPTSSSSSSPTLDPSLVQLSFLSSSFDLVFHITLPTPTPSSSSFSASSLSSSSSSSPPTLTNNDTYFLTLSLSHLLRVQSFNTSTDLRIWDVQVEPVMLIDNPSSPSLFSSSTKSHSLSSQHIPIRTKPLLNPLPPLTSSTPSSSSPSSSSSSTSTSHFLTSSDPSFSLSSFSSRLSKHQQLLQHQEEEEKKFDDDNDEISLLPRFKSIDSTSQTITPSSSYYYYLLNPNFETKLKEKEIEFKFEQKQIKLKLMRKKISKLQSFLPPRKSSSSSFTSSTSSSPSSSSYSLILSLTVRQLYSINSLPLPLYDNFTRYCDSLSPTPLPPSSSSSSSSSSSMSSLLDCFSSQIQRIFEKRWEDGKWQVNLNRALSTSQSLPSSSSLSSSSSSSSSLPRSSFLSISLPSSSSNLPPPPPYTPSTSQLVSEIHPVQSFLSHLNLTSLSPIPSSSSSSTSDLIRFSSLSISLPPPSTSLIWPNDNLQHNKLSYLLLFPSSSPVSSPASSPSISSPSSSDSISIISDDNFPPTLSPTINTNPIPPPPSSSSSTSTSLFSFSSFFSLKTTSGKLILVFGLLLFILCSCFSLNHYRKQYNRKSSSSSSSSTSSSPSFMIPSSLSDSSLKDIMTSNPLTQKQQQPSKINNNKFTNNNKKQQQYDRLTSTSSHRHHHLSSNFDSEISLPNNNPQQEEEEEEEVDLHNIWNGSSPHPSSFQINHNSFNEQQQQRGQERNISSINNNNNNNRFGFLTRGGGIELRRESRSTRYISLNGPNPNENDESEVEMANI